MGAAIVLFPLHLYRGEIWILVASHTGMWLLSQSSIETLIDPSILQEAILKIESRKKGTNWLFGIPLFSADLGRWWIYKIGHEEHEKNSLFPSSKAEFLILFLLANTTIYFSSYRWSWITLFSQQSQLLVILWIEIEAGTGNVQSSGMYRATARHTF